MSLIIIIHSQIKIIDFKTILITIKKLIFIIIIRIYIILIHLHLNYSFRQFLVYFKFEVITQCFYDQTSLNRNYGNFYPFSASVLVNDLITYYTVTYSSLNGSNISSTIFESAFLIS